MKGYWKQFFEREVKEEYYSKILSFLEERRSQGIDVFPKEDEIFTAFKLTLFENVKVVIIGQDPYHNFNEAMGLAFSVKDGVKIPPSLRNIYKELSIEYENYLPPLNGDLTLWAKRGVFLINKTLTVEHNKPLSHAKIGWEILTDKVVKELSDKKDSLVFMLWGADARSKADLIDNNRHLILEAAHPSPLSASRGFFGCSHFLECNKYLESKGIEPIDWQLESDFIM